MFACIEKGVGKNNIFTRQFNNITDIKFTIPVNSSCVNSPHGG